MTKTKGQQRVEMKKIEKRTSRNVTFSKRRNGLFKKVDELCSRDVDAAAVVISPMGKAFAIGYPSVGEVLARLEQSEEAKSNKNGEQSEEVKLLKNGEEGNPNNRWWDRDISGMNLDELEKYRRELVELKEKLTREAKN